MRHIPATRMSNLQSAWWEQLSPAIPAAYRDWTVTLLVDANANVGHDLSVHIGNPHAGADGTKADHFADFIRKHEIWLPATFDAFHTGPGETWFHPNGHVDAYPTWAYLEHGRSPNVRPGLVIRLILQSPKLTTFRLVLKYAFLLLADRLSAGLRVCPN